MLALTTFIKEYTGGFNKCKKGKGNLFLTIRNCNKNITYNSIKNHEIFRDRYDKNGQGSNNKD